jgi:hypothetical membrane protein
VAYAAYPGFSLLDRYISQLADPVNPGRAAFTVALVAAGPLVVLFALGLPRLLPDRPGRVAIRLLMVTGLAMPVVGAFDLRNPVPHFGAAAVLVGSTVLATLFTGVSLGRQSGLSPGPQSGGSTVLATLFAGLSLGRQAADGALAPQAADAALAPRAADGALAPQAARRAARLALATFSIQILSAIAGFVYTGVLVTRMEVVSASQLLKELPRHQRLILDGVGAVNPVALGEWLFLATAAVLIGLLSGYLLRATPRSPAQPRAAPRSPE